MIGQKLREAIAKRDLIEISKWLEVCDFIHSTGHEFKGCTPKDLPEDYIYEQTLAGINCFAISLP